ncbi:hypothetical protein [Streptomyces sp. NWU49]|nr:hypothetical protein [Streptomyces sp. NWU49]
MQPFDALETVRACEEKSEYGWGSPPWRCGQVGGGFSGWFVSI